ncbi:ABC transporter permease [Telmatospirillum sp.]|uniref:ABC transporter permease n=1 Tax=Telmatospirillum sp. TaxID=2079197 RepID=UPI002845EA12|nr:ABC transporter permease [Telmatospirillum sp.]MDR3441324.1 ABC transporter permease [Telmatospirillum sp.]
MLRHYILWALRNLQANRFTTAVNLFALSLGMVSFVLACGAALFLRSTDAELPNAGRIFAITQQALDLQSDFSTGIYPATSTPVAGYLAADYPEIEAVTRIRHASMRGVMVAGKAHFLDALYVDKSFGRIFLLPFRLGDPDHALTRPRSAILSEKAAGILFGNQNPLGKILTVGGLDVTVTGVTGAIAPPSQFVPLPNAFDVLLSDDIGEALDPPEPEPLAWQSLMTSTFILLPPGLPIETIDRKLVSFGDRHLQKSSTTMLFGTIEVAGFVWTGIGVG